MYINSRDNSFKGVVLRTLYRRGRRYSTLDTRKQVTGTPACRSSQQAIIQRSHLTLRHLPYNLV